MVSIKVMVFRDDINRDVMIPKIAIMLLQRLWVAFALQTKTLRIIERPIVIPIIDDRHFGFFVQPLDFFDFF